MPLRIGRVLPLVLALALLLAPTVGQAQEEVTPDQEAPDVLSLDDLGLTQDDLPPGFTPIPLFFLRYAPWDVSGETSWHEFVQGDDYVTSTVADLFSPERAYLSLPGALAPDGNYDQRWMASPEVGEEASLFSMREETLPGEQRGFEVKWRRGRFLGRVTVLGVSETSELAIRLARLVDSRMAAADPGQVGEIPDDEIQTIASQAQAIRGLERRGRTDFTIISPAVFGSLNDVLQSEIPGLEGGLLRMLGQTVDPVRLQQAEAGVGGVYSPNSNSVRLYANTWPLGWREQIVVAHEFTHVVEDQHFGLNALILQALLRGGQTSDVVLAVRSLPEGDANFTSHLWANQYQGPQAWDALHAEQDQALDDAKIPPLWRAQFLFPYREGERFVEGFYQDGGWAVVNTLYSRPPVSSEQVLHLDKYVADEAPIRVEAPQESGVATRGWHALRVDTLGEVGLRAVLQPFLDDERAASAAAGWGGDSYLLVGLDEQHPRGLVVDSVWDSSDEAEEFYQAMADSLDVRFAGQSSRRQAGASTLTWNTSEFAASVELRGEWVRLGIAPDRDALTALSPALP